jgi:hypothetical protein
MKAAFDCAGSFLQGGWGWCAGGLVSNVPHALLTDLACDFSALHSWDCQHCPFPGGKSLHCELMERSRSRRPGKRAEG